jgi:hypothetical protein
MGVGARSQSERGGGMGSKAAGRQAGREAGMRRQTSSIGHGRAKRTERRQQKEVGEEEEAKGWAQTAWEKSA